MRSIKLQSAMEYLMTYGWAILIIAVVLGALFQLGVFNSSSFSPRAPPGACQVFRPSGPGTTTNINLMGVCTGQLPQYVAKFNGASGYIDGGNSASLNVGLSSFTIASWIYFPGALSDVGRIVSKGCGWGALGWAFRITATRQAQMDIIFSGEIETTTTSSTTLGLNTWYFVVATINRNGFMTVYINGVADGSPTDISASSAININVAYDFAMGSAQPLTSAQYFKGLISNVQIYNTTLTANQIQALYLEGIGGAPMKLQNLVGWWSLNGNSNDYSGNNNNGVPTSVTFTSQYGK